MFTASSRSHIDDCGKFSSISDHAAMLVPFYYLPLIILMTILLKKVCTLLYGRIKSRSARIFLTSGCITGPNVVGVQSTKGPEAIT